ncbi:glycosyltransferase family 4 protein [Candidatus Bathyarchaeota archaeon]|nr:glycosyltransferase family 4 protein [Candidatus Bathyarchaeota archaeon]
MPGALFGGSQRVVWNVSKALVKRGHSVTVFTSDMVNNYYYRLSSPKYEEVLGIEIYCFHNLSKILSKTTRLIVTPEIVKALFRDIKSFDIIHLHEMRNFQQLVAALFSMKNEKPYVIQAHGTLPVSSHMTLKHIYDKTFLKLLLSKAQKIIAVNKLECEQFRAYGIPYNKIVVVPNGIDPNEFMKLPPKGAFKSRYAIKKSEHIILYLGRVARDKGVDVLIKAFALIHSQNQNIKLVIVGPDDGYLQYAKKLVSSLDLEAKVLFTGPLYGRDKLAAYHDADVYVLPSFYETFPLTILEAYMCFTPVIASNVGDMHERVRHGETGFLFKPGDIEELAFYLNYFMKKSDRVNEMGTEGRKLVLKQFSVDRIVGKLEKIYEEAISASI